MFVFDTDRTDLVGAGEQSLADSITLPVTEIQRHCMHDGPGVRSVVFLKGCPLSCAWCHNPETRSARQEILCYEGRCIGCGACVSACPTGAHTLTTDGHRFDRDKCTACGRCVSVCCTEALTAAMREMTVRDILSVVRRDRAFYGAVRANGRTEGGLTVSGGEPMAHPEGTMALLEAVRADGISTAVETCGYFPSEHLPRLVAATDLFLWDVKDTDPDRHKQYTGVSNERILRNLTAADALGAKTRLRCILVEGVNTTEAHYRLLADIALTLSHCEGVEFLPYHAYAGSKMLPLGRPDNGRREWIPSDASVEKAKTVLRERGVRVIG